MHPALRQQIEKVKARVPLFAPLDDQHVALLLKKHVNRIVFADGDPVFGQGDSADAMYVVLSGLVQVHLGENMVREAAAGHTLGAMAFLDGGPRLTTATAVGRTSVLRLSRAALDLGGEVSACLYRGLAVTLSEQLRAALTRVDEQPREWFAALAGSFENIEPDAARSSQDADAPSAAWDAWYREHPELPEGPHPWMENVHKRLPAQGRALVLAGAPGGDALWLARRGMEVTVADYSSTGLARLDEPKEQEALALRKCVLDLREDPLPRERYDLVVCLGFGHLPLLAGLVERLEPDAVAVLALPTIKTLQTNPEADPEGLLGIEEVHEHLVGLEVLLKREAWSDADPSEHELLLFCRPLM